MIVHKAGRQKGSALVVFMLIVLLSAVLGLALLSNTLTSHQSVLANENETRAKYLAEYAAYLGLNDLQKELENLGSGQFLSCGDFDTLARDLVRNFDKTGKPDPSRDGEEFSYKLEIGEKKLQEAKSLCEKNSPLGLALGYQYVVEGTLKASGAVQKDGKVPGEATFTVPVQISNISEVFNFALAAKENIWLNGGPVIQGDIYAGKALAVHPVVHYPILPPPLDFLPRGYINQNVYPKINGRIIMENPNALYRIPDLGLLGEPLNKADSLFEPQSGSHRLKGKYKTNLETMQKNKYLIGQYQFKNLSSVEVPELNMDNVKWAVLDKMGIHNKKELEEKLEEELGGSLDLVEKVKWTYKDTRTGITYHYITKVEKRCVFFCNARESTTHYTINKKNGPRAGEKHVYYVNGDLTIQGDEQAGDPDLGAVFYVSGNVKIEGIKRTTNKVAGIIVANGDIEVVYNRDKKRDETVEIKTFLWQNDKKGKIILYGVYSNIRIRGGLIAHNIVLNGSRFNPFNAFDLINWLVGKKYIAYDPSKDDYYFTKGRRKGELAASRLTIVYDEQFITHPPAGVPTNEGFKLSQIGQWEYVKEN